MPFIFWIFSGVIGGWLGGMPIRSRAYGSGSDFLIGLVGGLAGGLLGILFGLQAGMVFEQITAAAAGGAVLVWLLHILHPGTLRA